MTLYRITEGQFDIPESWSDKSLNIFALGEKTSSPLSLVISRDELKPGQELTDFAEEKLEEISTKLDKYNLLDQQQVELGGNLALEAEFTWRSDKGPMHQRQTFVQCGQRVLVFTVTAIKTLRDEQRASVDAVLATFKMRD